MLDSKEGTNETHTNTQTATSGTAVSRVCDQTNTRFAICINTQTSTIQVQFVQFLFLFSHLLLLFFRLFSSFFFFYFRVFNFSSRLKILIMKR